MNFILVNWVKYYTKEAFKTLKIVTVGSAIIVSVAFIKYRPVYKVTLSGETIGYIEDKERTEKKIEDYLNDTTGNIAYREISEKPEYEFKLVNRAEEVKERNILTAVENSVTTTYKTFAIISDEEQKTVVSSREEAENIINEVNEDLDKNVDLKLGIMEVYSTELTLNSTDDAKEVLNEFKTAKINEYKEEKAKAVAARAAKTATSNNMQYSLATTTDVAPSGSIEGMSLSIPVSGTISSRFGSRSSIRSSVHTGLDIACPAGTGIRPVSAGTVTFASYNGSYGNLIKINHGNGVETWYAHCSAIYVSVGQAVDTGTTIGAVGSTGNATGPHLHLEIRIGGAPVNPQNYLYK